jgi:A/G-specific adenine glycosylase
MRSVNPISPELPAWRRVLLAWYRRHRRALPWRATRDPYRIWVSEVMLQQTQVATARPYYRAFVRRFPTLASLAAARESQILAAWSGLGYYRRARHLHAAARELVRGHGGRLPAGPEAFRDLPGVGRYTMGAVYSIAFDRPLPVLDGNVARVLARLFARPWSARESRGARSLWALAATLVPMRRPGDWNQALMELGATVCLPRGPRCEACPVAAWCRARRAGRAEAYPPAAPRRATERVRRAVAVIEHRGRVLMTRRAGPLLDGMWEPPGVELGAESDPRAALGRALRALGVRARLEPTGRTVRHVITRRAIEVEVWRGTLIVPPAGGSALRWVSRRARAPLSALGARLAEAVSSSSR